MAVANILRWTLKWQGLAEEGDISAWFAHAPSLYTEADLNTALAAIDGRLASESTPSSWANLDGLLTSAQSYTDMALYQYASAPGPSSVLAHRAPSPARVGSGSTFHPLQVAACVTIHTGSASRRKRGRMYLPGHCLAIQPDTQMSDSITQAVVDIAAGVVGDVLNALRASLPGGDPIRHVVFSRAGGLSTDSTSFVADSRFDIQRRRAGSQKPRHFTDGAAHVNPTS